jgi:hypothetical protein
MDSSSTDPQSLSVDLQITEPHFDEEATLLSARPVVPLEIVTAKPRLNRSWAFGLTLTGAVMIGVIASAIYFTRYKSESLAAADSQTIFAGAEASTTVTDSADGSAAAVDGAGANGDTAVRNETSSVLSTTDGRSVQSGTLRTKPVVQSARKPATRRLASPGLADREQQFRNERQAARREAWERKHEARDDRSVKADDLFRIREIFEGRHRP